LKFQKGHKLGVGKQNRLGHKGNTNKALSDPRLALSRSTKLINKRLGYLSHLPIESWTPAIANEVTNYMKALRGTTKETEDNILTMARQVAAMSTEDLLRKLNDAKAVQSAPGQVVPET